MKVRKCSFQEQFLAETRKFYVLTRLKKSKVLYFVKTKTCSCFNEKSHNSKTATLCVMVECRLEETSKAEEAALCLFMRSKTRLAKRNSIKLNSALEFQ